MVDNDDPPLDEIQWRSPPIAREMGGIQTNTVLPYFSRSPFFDETSNNAALSTQALYNASMFHIIQTREAFENRLRSMAGLEFMVIHDPSDNGRQPMNTGVWVIRKQTRRKRNGMEDEIIPITSYFVIGENIYMAPSVGHVLGSRMLSTVTSLTKMMSVASTLPIFTPSLGYTYSPPIPKPISNSQLTQISKENTPMQDTQSTVTSASRMAFTSDRTPTKDLRDAVLLSESIALASRFAGEYMDENPLVGEPGSFILQKTREAALQPQPQAAHRNTPATKPSSPPTPAPLKTEGLPLEPKRGVKGGEKTPVTPSTKDKKRKRSKVAASITPT